jgi:hydrogenase maturation protease
MWAVFRRLLAGVGLLVAVAGFLLFATAVVGVWKLKAETNRRTDELAERAHSAISAADHAVTFVSNVITQANDDLKTAREQSPPAVDPMAPTNPFTQIVARQASEKLAGSVQRANAAVVTASDAAVVAEAALQLFGEQKEWKDWFGIKPEQLAQTQTQLMSASGELKQVRTLLGIPVAGGAPSAEALMTVETALNQARSFTDQMSNVVTNARKQVDETKQAVDLWVLRVAIAVTLIGVLGAVGQFFMARFCWRVLRNKPA